jgi:hypothetical protein
VRTDEKMGNRAFREAQSEKKSSGGQGLLNQDHLSTGPELGWSQEQKQQYLKGRKAQQSQDMEHSKFPLWRKVKKMEFHSTGRRV